MRRVLEISSFAFTNNPASASQAILGINLYPVDNTIGPPSIFIRCLALSNVLTTVVWLMRLTVHSFYHLLSPSMLRFTGILKLHGKERSETRIWAHTWKSNLRVDGQMCQSLLLSFWFIVFLRKRLMEFAFPIPGYSRSRFHYSVTWWLRCCFDKVQDCRFRHTRVTSLVEQHWHVLLWKKEIRGSKWT